MKIKGLLSILLIVFLLMGTWGCGISENIDDDPKNEDVDPIVYEPAFGGEINVPLDYIETLNPLVNEDLSLHYFNKLIFEGLFTIDENLDVASVLAKDYEISDDGRKIKVSLRDDVYWHDGEKFTAEDVVFTIDVIKFGTGEGIYKNFLNTVYKSVSSDDLRRIMDVNTLDDGNLEIIFDRGYSNALESLTFPIIPKHKFLSGDITTKEAYNRALKIEGYEPVGTGPYKFVNYEKLKSVSLNVNENWWKGKPYIEKINGKIIESEDLSITSFESKQVDVAVAKKPDWEKYSQKEDIDSYEYPSQNYVFLGFNFNNEMFSLEKGKVIRQAIAYGIDRQNIVDKAYLGHGVVSDTPILPNSWLSAGEINYNFNANKAKEILIDNGWKDSNNDGIYEDSEGKELTLRILTNSYNDTRKATADLIAENLKSIGIKVIKDYPSEKPEDITEEDVENQWNRVVDKVNEGNYDMVILEWQLSHIPDLSFAFHSSMIGDTNIIAYNNETMDNLIESAFSAKGRDAKKSSYNELESFIIEELPYVSLYFKNQGLLVNSKIKGEINPTSFNIYNNIEEWFVPEELQNNPENEEGVK